MIKELTKQYQENKHLLQKYFENTKQGEHTYENIVKKICSDKSFIKIRIVITL